MHLQSDKKQKAKIVPFSLQTIHVLHSVLEKYFIWGGTD